MAGWKFFIDGIKVDEPIGWDAVEFMAKRLEFHGIDQPFTTDISFIGKGAKILKSYFDSGFINDNIPFQITSNQIVNGLPYSFDGYINMAIYSEVNTCDTQGWQITVGIIEDPFRENFLTRQDVEIDLLTLKNLDQDDIDSLVLTEVRLHSQQLYLQGIGKDSLEVNVNASNGVTIPIYFDNSDFKGPFGNTFDSTGLSLADTNVWFQNNAGYTRIIEFKFNVKVEGTLFNSGGIGGLFGIQALIYNSDNSLAGFINFGFSPAFTFVGQTFTLDITAPSSYQNVTLLSGQRIQMVVKTSSGLVFCDFKVFAGSKLIVREFSTATASLCNGLYIYDFLHRILEIITGNSNPLVSDYFALGSGLMWNNFITTGFYIRNGQLLEETNPQITTTFKKFFEDLSRIFNLGWAFEWSEYYQQYQIRIEPMEYFYNNGIKIGDFERVSGIKQYALSEKLVNNFRIGFTDQWKNIAVSGIFEPHTYRSYFTPNKSRSGEKTVEDLRSGIIGSGYAIEFSRRLQFLRDDSGSSDRPNDYNLFLIWLNRESVTIDPIEETGYEVIGETGSVTFLPGKVSVGSDLAGTTNSPIESVYNILHTPARIAARFWKLLGMHTYGLPDAKAALFFQSGEYYTTLESEINNTYFPTASQEIQGTVSESTNISEAILAEGLNQYLFKPIGFDFIFPQSLCSFQTMANLGYGYVKVTSGNQTFYGFLLDATNKPVDPQSGETTFKLILAKNAPLSGDYRAGDYHLGDYHTGE